MTAEVASGPANTAPAECDIDVATDAPKVDLTTDALGVDLTQSVAVQLLVDHRSVVLELRTLPAIRVEESSFALEQVMDEPLRIVLTRPLSLRIKRSVDLALVLITVPVWVPAVGVLALLVKCTSRGPAFYGQRRVGQFDREIRCVKLRTMAPDAEEGLQALLASDDELRNEFLTTFKLKSDPRITRVGRILRRTGLDELPQLLNVLKGEMSLVGPRPVTLAETNYYGPYRSVVAAVPPGLTGLWQVSGRNDLPYERRVALDVEYAVARNLLGDFKIMIRTPAVLAGRSHRGAY